MRELKHFGCLLIGASLTFALAACGSKNDENEPINGGTDPGNKTEINTELTPEQQKQALDKTAKKALALIKNTDFNKLENIGNYVKDNLTSTKATEKIDKWWSDKLKSFWTDLGKRNKDMKVMQRIIDLSQIKGHFNVQNGQWVRTDADDLQMAFKDNNNKDCVLKLTLSGKQTSTYFPFLDTERRVYKGNGTYDRTKIETKVVVPEHATLTLTCGEETLLSAELNTKVTTAGSLDLAKDNIEANCKLTINQYVVEVKQMLFEASKGARFEASMKVGSQKLFDMMLSANGRATNEQIQGVGEIKMALDILGEVQLKGVIDDGSAFNKPFREINEGNHFVNGWYVPYTEKEFKGFIDDANKHINAGLFFNGSAKRSANIEMGAFAYNMWDYYTNKQVERWRGKVVIKFADNTSYAFADYFTKDNFPSVFEQARKLIDSFERMFNY